MSDGPEFYTASRNGVFRDGNGGAVSYRWARIWSPLNGTAIAGPCLRLFADGTAEVRLGGMLSVRGPLLAHYDPRH